MDLVSVFCRLLTSFPSSSKDLLNENYKPLKREIEEDIRDGKISHAHGLAESTL
jgi:hypothetical protein